MFLLPSFLGFCVFIFAPMFGGLALSFFDWDLFHSPRFIGLRNFHDLLGWSGSGQTREWNDADFWKYLGNTLYLLIAVPISIVGSLALALLLNQKLRGRVFFRTVFFLPTICFGVAVLLLWRNLLEGDFGLVNALLRHIGITGPDWLNDSRWVKPAFILMNLWVMVGGTNMVIYLAGLSQISPELYEAATVDGAAAWQRFWHVTLPMLRPTTLFILVTSIIAGFNGELDSVYILTRGGPDGASTTLSYYVFTQGFRWFNMGYAAAIGSTLMVIIIIATLLNWRLAGGAIDES
jgi:ABC-type sugar transport system permease subunit